MDAWKMGLKAVAIYRDNCKVAQPLSMGKKEGSDKPAEAAATAPSILAQAITESLVQHTAIRRELPRIRNAKNFKFTVAGTRGYVIVGEYDDGTPGELFISSSKMGSTLRGVMDAFGIAISYGLQYGVPLKSYVRVFANTSFAPAGITDDPEIRTASSLIDYIFRRLGKTYLSFDDRLEVGLASIDEQPEGQTSLLADATPQDALVEQAMEAVAEAEAAISEAVTTVAASTADLAHIHQQPDIPQPTTKKAVRPDDSAPLCYNCGNQTQKAGSCYVCTSCGSTTGCS
jgi:ribonucleoside-diphosphate reductase alpha chain